MSAEPRPSAVPLMQLATAFWGSKTLAAAVELDLFSRLSGRGTDVAQLAEMLGIEARPAEMLLAAGAALGLLTCRDGRYHNTPLAEEYLVRGKPHYFGGVVTMIDRRLYLPWNRLAEALRTNRPQSWGDASGLFEAMAASPEEQRLFTECMHGISVHSGRAVAAAVDLSRHRLLLDVGGASAAYCIEAAKRHPELRAIVFDLPPALEIAREKIAEAGVADRVTTHPGDFFREVLPAGSDAILLSMILHDWSPAENRAIVARCFDALEPGGTLIVSELMMDDDKTGPAPAALMSLNMLIETAGGRNYTWAEYAAWVEEAGFHDVRRIPIESPGANGLLVARK